MSLQNWKILICLLLCIHRIPMGRPTTYVVFFSINLCGGHMHWKRIGKTYQNFQKAALTFRKILISYIL